MSNPRCPLCGRAAAKLLIFAPDYRRGDARRHAVWLCTHCDVGMTASAWDENARAQAYAGDYAPHQDVSRLASGLRRRVAASIRTGFGYPQPDALPLPRFLARSLARVRNWTWAPPPPPPGRLLDVGCGGGAYGASLIRLGWRVDGIEPDARAAARARRQGLTVQQTTAEEAVLPASVYDVITLWHSLEHLSNPVAALQKLHPSLRDDGLLLVEVPNRAGWGAKLTGEYWYHWDLPRHRVHFTPESLRRVLEQSGFHVEKIQHIPNPHGVAGALAYRFGRSGLARNRIILALGWLFGLTAAIFRHGDVIRATAIP